MSTGEVKPMHETTMIMNKGNKSTAAKVLIIGSSPEMLSLLKAVCGRAGRDVEIHTTIPGGMKATRRIGPDLVILDVASTGIDGYAAARDLSRDPMTSFIPLLAICGDPFEAMRDLAIRSGFSSVVEKGGIAVTLERVMIGCIGVGN